MASTNITNSQSDSLLLNLPSELLESIIVFTTAQGCPTAASALARTCRTLRVLVYGAVDQHLWRELFLSVFDDPRIAWRADRTDSYREYRSQSSDDEALPEGLYLLDEGNLLEMEKGFDWGTEFRTRVWAGNYVRSRALSSKACGKVSMARTSKSSTATKNIRALEALAGIVEAALPSPPTVIISIGGSASRDGTDILPPALSLNSNYPIFPPPPTSYTSFVHSGNSTALPTFAQATSSISSGSGPVILGHNCSMNVRWLEETTANGLPADLAKKVSGLSLPGGLQGVWDNPTEAKEMRAFCKLICYTGFLPVPHGESISTDPTNPEVLAMTHRDAVSSPVCMENGICRVDDGPDVVLSPTTTGIIDETNPEEPASSSRLSPKISTTELETLLDEYDDDFWDIDEDEMEKEPKLPMAVNAQQNRARRMARMRVYNLRYLHPDRHWGPYLLPPHLDRPSVDPKPEMFLQPILALFADHDAGHPHHHHENDGNLDFVDFDEDEEEQNPENGNGPFEIPNLDRRAGRPLPSPGELYPDWAFLAAARIVVEANLSASVGVKDISGLVWLDSLRRESAPRAVRQEGEPDDGFHFSRNLSVGLDGDGSVAGWDWAGVTGSWRRCVCWMDYRDLITQNVEKPERAFSGVSLEEAVRIIPMRLRVASYSACPIPGYSHRPTIHVVGESAGPAGTGSIRKMKGTVGIIADGSIRWNLFSFFDDEEGAAEWVTEGIQLGAATSAMGVLGMWTGARHDRMDPIGPFWMWKVG